MHRSSVEAARFLCQHLRHRDILWTSFDSGKYLALEAASDRDRRMLNTAQEPVVVPATAAEPPPVQIEGD